MVFIVPPNGEKFVVDVNPSATTLHQLKVAIEKINGMPVSNQRLFDRENDSDLICDLVVGPFSTLTLLTTTPSSVASSSAAEKIWRDKEAIRARKRSEMSEEDKELDRKTREELDKKLLPGYEEPEDDEDTKLIDADLERTFKRSRAKMTEISQAQFRLDVKSIIKEMMVEERKYRLRMKEEISQAEARLDVNT